MPQQIFQVLRCYKCAVFQVHQAKKSNKWACKMCGEKQSVKRHYGIGTGKECRQHVQRLNGLRGDRELSNTSVNSDSDNDHDEAIDAAHSPVRKKLPAPKSKWSNFVEEEPEQSVEESNSMYLDDVEVVLEPPKKRKYSRGASKTSKFAKHNSAYNNVSDNDDRDRSSMFANIQGHNSGIDNDDKIETCLKKKYVPPTSLTNLKWECTQKKNNETINCGDSPQDYQSNRYSFNELPNRSILQPKQMQPLNNSKQYQDCQTNRPLSPKNKHSKWAQYIEEEVIEDENDGIIDNEVGLTNICMNSLQTVYSNVGNDCDKKGENLQNLFALTNDDDLDNVLKF